MRKLMRVLIWSVGALLLLGVVLWASLPVFLGPAVKRAAEAAGPAVAGVPINVENVNIHPWKGSAIIDGLVVGAPEGFAANLAEMSKFSLKLNVRSLFSDTIIVEEVVISAPVVTYEISGIHSNVGALIKNLESDEEKPEPDKKAAEEKSGGKKVVIEHFLFEKGRVRLATKLTQGKGIVFPLPKIELRDLGKGSEEKSALDLTREMVGVVSVAVLSVVRDGITGVAGLGADVVESVAGAAGAALSGAGDLAGSAIKGVGHIAAGGLRAAGEGVKAVGDVAGAGVKAVGGAIGSVAGIFKSGADKEEKQNEAETPDKHEKQGKPETRSKDK